MCSNQGEYIHVR